MIFISCLICTILIIWFKTDAFIEYSKLLNIHHLFKIDKWEEYKTNVDCEVTYHTYLKLQHSYFIIRLMTCPICLGFVLTVMLSIITIQFSNIPIIFILTLFIYNILIKLMK